MKEVPELTDERREKRKRHKYWGRGKTPGDDRGPEASEEWIELERYVSRDSCPDDTDVEVFLRDPPEDWKILVEFGAGPGKLVDAYNEELGFPIDIDSKGTAEFPRFYGPAVDSVGRFKLPAAVARVRIRFLANGGELQRVVVSPMYPPGTGVAISADGGAVIISCENRS